MSTASYDLVPNETLIDIGDPFEEETDTEEDRYYKLLRQTSMFREIMDIINFFLCCAVIIFDIYLVVVIARNKKLKSTKTYKLIKYYVVLNILSFLTLPLLEIFIDVFKLWMVLTWRVFCFSKQMEDIFMVMMLICAGGLAYDWLITVKYNSKVSYAILLKINEHFVSINYGFFAALVVFNVINCVTFYETIFPIFLTVLFSVLLIFIATCVCLNRGNNSRDKNNFPLTISSVMIFCYLPLFVYHILDVLAHRKSYTFLFILRVTEFIPQYIANGSPIIVGILLAKLNKYYRVAFTKCCNRGVKDYVGDDEEFEESDNDAEIINENVVNNATPL